MSVMAYQITSHMIVYSTVYSGSDERKSSASLAFVWGIHRWLVNSPHKGQWRGKCFYLMTSSCVEESFWYDNVMTYGNAFRIRHVLKKSTPKSISNFDSLHIFHKKHCHHTYMTNRFPKCTLSRWINNMHQYADKNWKLLCLLFENGRNLTEQSTGNGTAKLQLAQKENNHFRGANFGKIGNRKCLDFILCINTTLKVIFMEQKDIFVWCSLPYTFLSH